MGAGAPCLDLPRLAVRGLLVNASALTQSNLLVPGSSEHVAGLIKF